MKTKKALKSWTRPSAKRTAKQLIGRRQSGVVAKQAAYKRTARRNRPLHKRFALHPASILVFLCVGVLLWSVTFRSSADSYTVNAVVPAPIPLVPAVLTDPADQTHFTTTPVDVRGTCPENSYVNLSRNNVFSGSAICGPGQTSFEIATDLSLGSNVLLPQVFNVTDQPGPASSPITVFLDSPPPTPPPATTPENLQVTSADNTSYEGGNVAQVSSYVTVRGVAPPYAHIVATFHSAPITCITDADGDGNWSCTLAQPLQDGLHTVSVVATTREGRTLVFPTFRIRVSHAVSTLRKVSSQPSFLITTSFQYRTRLFGKAFGLTLGLSAGTSPYAVTIEWGDGARSTFARNDSSNFLAEHTYKLSKTNQRTYLVKIGAVDSAGTTAFLQLAESVHRQGAVIGVPVIGDISAGIPPLSQIKQWLWLLWPSYVVVSLMILSFWLGERQEYGNLFRRTTRRHRRA